MVEQLIDLLAMLGLEFEKKATIEDIVVILALLVTLLSIWLTYSLSRKADEREARVEKSAAYMQLETHSSEIFRYQADNFKAMKGALNWQPQRSHDKPSEDDSFEMTRQFYLQCLNLFEVASNFRKKHIVDHGVYASWVAWFWELTEQPYFRHLWAAERENYTDDVRNIFDAGIALYDYDLDDALRKRIFYQAVSITLIEPRASWRELATGMVIGTGDALTEIGRWLTRKPKSEACEEIAGWLDKCGDDSAMRSQVARLIADQESETGCTA